MRLTLQGSKVYPVWYSNWYERTALFVALDVEGVRFSKCYAMDYALKMEKHRRVLACA